jgi:hypothetical protein
MKSFLAAWFFLAVVGLSSLAVVAQSKAGESSQKLPSAGKVIEGYLKAIGGKKQVAAVRDATYEWVIKFNDQTVGLATTHIKAPASVSS